MQSTGSAHRVRIRGKVQCYWLQQSQFFLLGKFISGHNHCLLRKIERVGGGRKEILEVPPAVISTVTTFRHTKTHVHTLDFQPMSHFFIQGHLTAAAYGGGPRPGPTNHTNKPAAYLSGPVTQQVVI